MTPDINALVSAAINDFQLRRPQDAEAKLLSLGPVLADVPLGLQLMSLILANRSRADSDALLERAARLAPGDGQAQFNVGVAVQAQGDLARAVLHYQQALRDDLNHLGALNNLSDLFRRRGRGAEGWALMERYIRLGGDMRSLEVRAAKLAMDTRQFDLASEWFETAERNKPNDASTEFEHSMLLLAREDWARGWSRYDRRVQLHGIAGLGIYPHPMPLWRGEPVASKSVLIHREQGMGDMIMFADAIPGLIAEAAAVHIAVHPPLVRLFARNFPKARVWASDTVAGGGAQPEQPWRNVAGPIQYQAPFCMLGSLRLAQGFSGKTFLKAHDGDTALWKARLDVMCRPGRRRVGLVLGSRPTGWSEDGRRMAANKSIPPREAFGFAEARGVEWVGLHDRETSWMLADVPGLECIDPSPLITDFADTAAIIANLDLVVTIDSAVAHLAGAMGKPTLLLLWWNPDWRWQIDKARSSIYPSVEMITQTRAHDWQPVIAEAVRRLG
jgi:hypothetical protein